jgi:hypothetical protein
MVDKRPFVWAGRRPVGLCGALDEGDTSGPGVALERAYALVDDLTALSIEIV